MFACDENFSIHRHYFANSNGGDVRKCISNLVSNFYNDKKSSRDHSFNEIDLGLCRKNKELPMRDIPLIAENILEIPTVGMCENKFQMWCSNFTTIQRLINSRSSFYLDKFRCMQKNKEFWERKKRKRKSM